MEKLFGLFGFIFGFVSGFIIMLVITASTYMPDSWWHKEAIQHNAAHYNTITGNFEWNNNNGTNNINR